MGYGCYGTGFQRARSYLTKEERIAMLKEYKDELEKEGQGVVERIKELEASWFDPAFFFWEQSKTFSINTIFLIVLSERVLLGALKI